MKWDEMFEIIKKLPYEQPQTIYKKVNYEIYLLRPDKEFKSYDKRRNFQIFIKTKNRTFRPNHLRVFIDLNLRVRSRPDLKKKLLLALDNVFYKKDPVESIKELKDIEFKHSLNPFEVTAILSQLFLIEQEYNYLNKSKYDPKTLFYQGWIRQFIDNPKEIDNLCMSVCNRQTPLVRYTYKENKNHKRYTENIDCLWYLEKMESKHVKKT